MEKKQAPEAKRPEQAAEGKVGHGTAELAGAQTEEPSA